MNSPAEQTKTKRQTSLIPNSCQTPNVYYDRYMPFLTGDEWMVLSYTIRRTLGFHKRRDRISLSQYATGKVNKDGKQMDFGTGLSVPTIRKCLAELTRFGLVLEIAPNNPKNQGALYDLQLNYKKVDFAAMRQRRDSKAESAKLKMGKMKDRRAMALQASNGIAGGMQQHYTLASNGIATQNTEGNTEGNTESNTLSNEQLSTKIAPIPGQGKLTALQVASESPTPPVTPPPPSIAPAAMRWIYPLQGDIAHLVMDSNLPEKTLCGITTPSHGSTSNTRQIQCQACLKAAAAKPKRQRKPQPSDPLFDAIAAIILGITDKAGREAAGWRIGQIMNGDKRSGRCNGLIAYEQARQGKDDLDYESLAKDVKRFWDWFSSAHPDMELRDCAKVMERWAEWRSSVKSTDKSALVPHPDDPTRMISPGEYRTLMAQKRNMEAHYGSK